MCAGRDVVVTGKACDTGFARGLDGGVRCGIGKGGMYAPLPGTMRESMRGPVRLHATFPAGSDPNS